MPQLTNARLAQIKEILNSSLFTSAGYIVETYQEPSRIVKVTFRDNQSYFISLSYHTKKLSGGALLQMTVQGEEAPRVLHVTESPGDFTQQETREIDDFGSFLNAVSSWMNRVSNDVLLVNVFQKKLDEFQEELNQRLDKHVGDSAAHFSDDEKEDILAKLRVFEERFSALANKNEAVTREVADLKVVVEGLARAVNVLPKRAFWRTACSKIFTLSMRGLSSPVVQELLRGEARHLLDEIQK